MQIDCAQKFALPSIMHMECEEMITLTVQEFIFSRNLSSVTIHDSEGSSKPAPGVNHARTKENQLPRRSYDPSGSHRKGLSLHNAGQNRPKKCFGGLNRCMWHMAFVLRRETQKRWAISFILSVARP